ncbi:hypothetical protein QQS21_008931 [Conoideocrella luteorostrata]|uniref:Mitogen-activated protein kinase-binding protein 1 n=1 Tax=Conoideocrella luteorostrata TaxID=1105319 RepID=A0AAJ0CHX4_9HYPO|nr:hypothetical protein QQS21_008931 [Conoideocrella luteorostrata]
MRGRPMHESRLSLRRVVGTTCRSPTGFDTVNSSFAYIAGGAVVVVDVEDHLYSQRFYRARPTAVPVYSVSSSHNTPSTPIATTPKANDSRNRVAPNYRDSPYSPVEWADSPSGSKTWTSRERIKAATCLALSPDGRYLAVGETGYAPRVLIFSLLDASSDTPLVSISEHAFGVTAVAWSADSRYLASLGTANDGYLFVWKVDPRTGAAKLFQQNRCTSYIRDMVWMDNNLITLGVRHVKVWKIEDSSSTSPTKPKFLGDTTPSTPTAQKTLPGRNMLLGNLLEATFSCAAVDGKRLILCTEAGDVCILDDDDRQMRLTRVLNLEFCVTTITIRGNVVYVGGRDGQFATLDAERVMDGCANSILTTSQTSTGIIALGFLPDKLVTIDSKQSIDVWNPDYLPGQQIEALAHIPIPGHGEPIMGIHSLYRPNKANAAFITWSASGNVTFWDLDGQVKLSFDVPVEHAEPESEHTETNQLTSARTTRSGKLLVTADRQGVIKVIDVDSKDCLLDIKAHAGHCLCISIYDEDSKFLMACCGRDRTAQLFHRDSNGKIEHFQTLEFAAKVVQVLIPAEDRILTCSLDRTLQIYDVVSREGEPDIIAAIPSKVISLKASPTSMAMGPDNRTVYVSLLDRSIYQYDLVTGRQICCFKCMDEGGVESAVLDSLFVGQWPSKDLDFLLGSSNTDKSIRLYDANNGTFLDREWGHTEAINGVSFVDDDDGSRKVVSVGSDGTIMVWTLDLNDPSPRSMSRDPSPVKEITASGRPTLRKVLSRAELAEFQRPSPSPAGRRSPPRTLRRRTSRLTLGTVPAANRTPIGNLTASPSDSAINEDTPSRRRPSEPNRGDSPPASPKSRVTRTPSMPALSAVAKRKTSSSNLRAFGSLNMATEQACRTLRAYRKKLSSAEPITADVLTELDQELRLTAAALGDRAIRSKAMNETVLSGLLDQYSERLVTLLDEKLRLTNQLPKDQDLEMQSDDRPRSADGTSSSSSP